MGGNKLKKLIVIYRVVQVFLLGLLVYMAYSFQQIFQAKGMPQIFLNSIVTAIVIQLLLFYPIRKFALAEAEREAASAGPDLSVDALKALRQRRIFSDILKMAVFLGFTIFILLAPSATFVMSTAFFCFILTLLTYFQCFNFAVARAIKKN